MANIDPLRFWRWFDELAAIGRSDNGWNRLAWSPLEAEARDWFTGVAEGLGLEIRRDGAGTLWAVTADADSGPWVCAGSHLDTQPNGGAYDGALGMVSALEAAAALLESEAERHHPLAVVAFVDEEGARFRVPCFGSRAITGELDIDRVLATMDGAEAIYDVSAETLRAAPAQLRRVRAMLEVHVEQGLSLADRDLALGIATVLAPRQRWQVEFHGQANHAGTTMMDGRRDALVEAARFVLAVDAAARARAGAVATVGRLQVFPGSTNAIPGRGGRRPRRARTGRPHRGCDRAGAALGIPHRHLHPRVAQRRNDLRSGPARAAGRRRGGAQHPRRRPPVLCRTRCGHPRPPRPRSDGVRAKSRREPATRRRSRPRGPTANPALRC